MVQAAAIYARISSDPDGTRLGVERQVEDCEAIAASLAWPVVEVFVDNDVSAYSGERRPEYERLCEDIKAGTVDALVVWHPDRQHRSPRELEDFIDLCDAASLTDIATVRAGDVDLTTPQGRMVARLGGVIARGESDKAADRLRRKHAELATKGKVSGGGTRPYGYTQDRRHIVPGEDAIIREAAKRTLAGESARSICSDLNERGIGTSAGGEWTPNTLNRMLRSARISGRREHRGEITQTASRRNTPTRPPARPVPVTSFVAYSSKEPPITPWLPNHYLPWWMLDAPASKGLRMRLRPLLTIFLLVSVTACGDDTSLPTGTTAPRTTAAPATTAAPTTTAVPNTTTTASTTTTTTLPSDITEPTGNLVEDGDPIALGIYEGDGLWVSTISNPLPGQTYYVLVGRITRVYRQSFHRYGQAHELVMFDVVLGSRSDGAPLVVPVGRPMGSVAPTVLFFPSGTGGHGEHVTAEGAIPHLERLLRGFQQIAFEVQTYDAVEALEWCLAEGGFVDPRLTGEALEARCQQVFDGQTRTNQLVDNVIALLRGQGGNEGYIVDDFPITTQTLYLFESCCDPPAP